MSDRPLHILQVSASDVAGGAERSARNLTQAYRAMGHDAWLAVGHRRGDDPSTVLIDHDSHRNPAVRAIDHLRRNPQGFVHRIRGLGRLTSLLRRLAEPGRTLGIERGREDFDFPGTARLLELPPVRPDIVHLHNLHGEYFDLGVLPWLSREVPTILNVRDGWLMSGHCAFSLGCERWRTGCGECPDLSLYPAVKRDATSFNWSRKRSILADSRLYVSTPSEWMMSQVRESIIAAAAVQLRVIPNGVDTHVFSPGQRRHSRMALGLPLDARVLLVAANGLRFNVWKDYETLRGAIEILGRQPRPEGLVVLAVGEVAEPETIGSVQLRFVPFESRSERLADYYRAADLYLHAARVESFGNVLLEARACGTPVVATAVGGIPEQILALEGPWTAEGLPSYPSSRATGVLVPPADPAAFAAAIESLLQDSELRRSMAENGLQQVRNEFSLERQAARFLEWYREILASSRAVSA